VPLTQDQLVRLATNDLSDPKNAEEARGWLDGLHHQEYNLRDILGRVLLAAERVSPPSRPSRGQDGEVVAELDVADGLGHEDRQGLERIAADALARAESRPLRVTDNDAMALTRYLSDRIHNETMRLRPREAYDRAQELMDAARSEAAHQRAHAARVAGRVLEIVREDQFEPGAAVDVLTALRQRVEAELGQSDHAVS
jgi:hypothetical protein